MLKTTVLILNFYKKSLNLSLLMVFQAELIVDACELLESLKLHLLEQTFYLREYRTNKPKPKDLLRIKIDESFQPTKIQ